jgi:hypothetical protein
MRSILLSTASLLASSFTARAQQLHSNHFGKGGVNATYDYVIVGGGTVG